MDENNLVQLPNKNWVRLSAITQISYHPAAGSVSEVHVHTSNGEERCYFLSSVEAQQFRDELASKVNNAGGEHGQTD